MKNYEVSPKLANRVHHKKKNKFRLKKEHTHSEIADEQRSFLKAQENLQETLEKADECNKRLKKMVEFTTKENEQLLNRSAKALQFQMEKESLQSELQTVTLELKRVTASKMKAKKEVKVKTMVKQTKVKTLIEDVARKGSESTS